MKTFLHIKTTAAFFLLFLIPAGTSAQSDNSFKKEINKEFNVNQDTRLEVYNKYGDVDVVNHSNASLVINAVVTVKARNKEQADELLKMITVTISQEGNTIKSVTEIDDNFGRNFGNVRHGDEFKINVKVTMPSTVPVYLSNKYGNVFIDEIVSTSTIDVKYGKLTANKILHDSKQPLSKVYLAYSTGSIQESKWLEADIKYSKLTLNTNQALAIISKYSKIYLDNGSSIVSETKYDTYEVGKLANFVANAGYSHINIGSLSGKLQLETKYTDVKVDNIPASFEEIKVENSYGTYKLGIASSASYKLNSYSKYCDVIYPDNSRVNRINENQELKVNGVIGDAGSAKADVNINSRYGNIRLVE